MADGQTLIGRTISHFRILEKLGGGGNFGVVTAFEYALHPVSDVLAGTLDRPLAERWIDVE